MDRVQVRIVKPSAGAAMVEANKLRQRLAEIDTELSQIEGMCSGDADQQADGVAGRWEEAQIRRSKVCGELEQLLATSTITVDVQRATPVGEIRYRQALEEVAAWRIAQQVTNQAAAGEPISTTLDATSLNKQQGLEYVVMVNCAAIEGAVCRDAQGRPIATNFDWPAGMHDWTQAPGDVVEQVLRQVYVLNPAWILPQMRVLL